ncbi:MAG: tetratricopeptide repeat protein [Euryarchaeota archaeon]|nr:tetratricopeptide repeat protein [Euryarchaeota archaeon]
MDLFGIDLIIWAGIAAMSIVSLMAIWKIARWKGELDLWKREVDEWRNNVTTGGIGGMESIGMQDMQVHSDNPEHLAGPRISFFEEEKEHAEPGIQEAVGDGEMPVPEIPDSSTEIALLYALTGRAEEACRVAGIKNDKAAIHHDLGNILYRSKQFDEAEREYREAINYEPGFAKARANLGFLLQKLERHDEAAEEFRAALESKEQLPDGGERILQILSDPDDS